MASPDASRGHFGASRFNWAAFFRGPPERRPTKSVLKFTCTSPLSSVHFSILRPSVRQGPANTIPIAHLRLSKLNNNRHLLRHLLRLSFQFTFCLCRRPASLFLRRPLEPVIVHTSKISLTSCRLAKTQHCCIMIVIVIMIARTQNRATE